MNDGGDRYKRRYPMSSPKRLYRNAAAGRIAGVCAGIADYLDADVTLIRLIWVVLSIVPGCLIGGVIAYLIAWAVMEDSKAPVVADPSRRRLTRSRSDRKIGGVCGGLADYLSVDATVVRLLWVVLTIFPGAFVLGGVAYLVAWFIMPESPSAPVVVSPSVA
jgi:phage shock protein PspC (stress-responsive transcriptional regulator)